LANAVPQRPGGSAHSHDTLVAEDAEPLLLPKKIGVLSYQVPQSADCAKGLRASFEKYPSAKIEFLDTSLTYGVTDLSSDVSQMKDKGVDFVATCMDTNGTLTLAKEMKKQGLEAIQYLSNAYNRKFIEENAQFFEDSYVSTFFTPFEVKPKPKGLKDFQKWMKKGDFEQNENSLAGWINADLFYQASRRRVRSSPARSS
jgi:ABC-type branched-subunit amino acid transport system substrate-binding protein